jgi:hypothetical protein
MASATITQVTTARASTYFSAFSTLRRDHHWVCWLQSIRPVSNLAQIMPIPPRWVALSVARSTTCESSPPRSVGFFTPDVLGHVCSAFASTWCMSRHPPCKGKVAQRLGELWLGSLCSVHHPCGVCAAGWPGSLLVTHMCPSIMWRRSQLAHLCLVLRYLISLLDLWLPDQLVTSAETISCESSSQPV